MNEVRFIQKIGQVPLATLVETAAMQGFALAGSPTLISHVPAQLMIQVGVNATKPEYIIVEKTGQMKIQAQIEKLLDEGWELYGSLIPGEVPMQAMVRGDIGVHRLFGSGEGGPSGELPPDWDAELEEIKANIAEIYAALNSLHNYGPDIDKARDEAIATSKADLKEASDKVDKKFETQSNQVDQVWTYVDQKNMEMSSVVRGEVEGLNQQIETLRLELAMETSERQQDVMMLNDRIDQLGRIMAQLVDQPVS